jgi:hypothetical protein
VLGGWCVFFFLITLVVSLTLWGFSPVPELRDATERYREISRRYDDLLRRDRRGGGDDDVVLPAR